jgi:Predicted glycosyltransferases
MSNVAIVILNWNGEKLLREFLPKVIETSKDYQIIVADNGSVDSSVELLKRDFSSVRLIELGANYGFAGGYNRALKQVEADYYVLLNSDIAPKNGWVEPIITLMESDQSIACCQPKLLSYCQPDTFEYAGGAGGYIDYLGYPFCRGRIFSCLEKDTGQYDSMKEIFWATGAALFVRANLFHTMGGLDEDFFAHQEEIDLCWRFKNAGYKIYCQPQSVCYHVGGASLNKTSPLKTFLNFRNNLFLLYKNLPDQSRNKILFVRFFLDIIASLTFALQGKGGEFCAVYKAYKDFWCKRSKMRAKRGPILNFNIKEVYPHSIVFAYHFSARKKFSSLEI